LRLGIDVVIAYVTQAASGECRAEQSQIGHSWREGVEYVQCIVEHTIIFLGTLRSTL